MRALQVLPLPHPHLAQVLPLPHPHLALLLLLLLLLSPAGGGAAHLAHLGQPQVAPVSPLEPRAPAPLGDGQRTWRRPPAQPPLPALLLLLPLLQQPRLRLLLPHL
ncbi:unnamed protein product, partial [Coccothraustes coccothraustes]